MQKNMNESHKYEPNKKAKHRIAPCSLHHLSSLKLLGAHRGLFMSSTFQSHAKENGYRKIKA